MRFANRMKILDDRELVDLMELAEAEDTISFSGGFPSPDTYPMEDIRKTFYHVLEKEGREALSYSSANGYKPLRKLIAERMNRFFHTDLSLEEIIITSGSQQALDMSGLLFIDKDDVILFETPSYLGAINALKAYEAELVAVPTDEDGIQIDSLKEAIKRYGSRVKLIYVIPDFQNPTSRCWSDTRRQEFVKVIQEYDIAVVEDAAYAELAFDGRRHRPLFSYDDTGHILYCGTFSKTFCPGLRVAWVAAKHTIIEQLMILKTSVDLSSSALTQHQIVNYLNDFDYDGHIKSITSLYRKRRDKMMEVIDREFPAGVSYAVPQGGLFLWLRLPEHKNAKELLARALKEKVSFVPGGAFYPKNEKNHEMRINFSNMSEEDIEKGMTILGRLAKAYLAE